MILALWLLGCVHHAPEGPVVTEVAPLRLGTEARAVVEAAAADLDVSVRRRAVALLVESEPAAAGGSWAARGRYDPSPYVQRAVVEALGRRGDGAEVLRTWVDDAALDPWVRGAAALVLARSPSEAPRLATAAASVRGGRAGALLLAATMTGDAEARRRLREAIEAANLPMELWFLDALGASGLSELAGPLGAVIDQVEPEIRLPVARAAWRLGSPAGEKALAEALAGADEDVGLEAVELLADTPGSGTLLAGTAGTDIVGTAAALARFGQGEGEARTVVAALSGEDGDLAIFAAGAAARRLTKEPDVAGADRIRAAVREGLEDAAPGVLLLAPPILAGGSPADREALRGLLSAESAEVRIEAAIALGG